MGAPQVVSLGQAAMLAGRRRREECASKNPATRETTQRDQVRHDAGAGTVVAGKADGGKENSEQEERAGCFPVHLRHRHDTPENEGRETWLRAQERFARDAL